MCFYTPRFSYRCPGTVICTCPRGHPAALVGGCAGVYQGGYGTGWVYRVGIPGAVPSRQGRTRKVPGTSGAGPGSPLQGDWSGWVPGTVPSTSAPTLRARSWGLQPHSLVLLEQSRLRANTARFDLISYKVSQNGEVSPECHEKACHSPYIQKRLPKVAS